MSAGFAVQSIFEITAVLLLIWGFINEKKFIAFENKLARAIAINILNHQHRKIAEQKRAEAEKQNHEQPVPFTLAVQQSVQKPLEQECPDWGILTA